MESTAKITPDNALKMYSALVLTDSNPNPNRNPLSLTHIPNVQVMSLLLVLLLCNNNTKISKYQKLQYGNI